MVKVEYDRRMELLETGELHTSHTVYLSLSNKDPSSNYSNNFRTNHTHTLCV